MKERPVLFSGPMVRAIIEGRKTQTRRILQWPEWLPEDQILDAIHAFSTGLPSMGLFKDGLPVRRFSNPYGQPGDRLWVRETWAPHADEEQTFANYDIKTRGISGPCSIEEGHVRPEIFYRADGGDPFINNWRPSIHMPRWASRLTLAVESVRVERLQDISEEDARAEGVTLKTEHHDPRDAFAWLWTDINGQASWDANPWVWVVGFKVAEVRR